MSVSVFLELSIIIALATIIAIVVRLLKQPLIIAYIITGIIASPYLFGVMQSDGTVALFSQIGIVFLLFVVGLNLRPNIIRDVGKISLLLGLGQVLLTFFFGFLLSRFLHFSFIESLYLSFALTFSSTIIVMKLLSDKRDLDTLYGKISAGVLIIQDIFVIFILLFIASFSHKQDFFTMIVGSLANGLMLLGVFFFLIYLMPRIGSFFARSQEFLFLFSLSVLLGFASLAYYFEFSIEIGALIAGVALSMTPYSYEISSKMKPLRDFFMILFFVSLGSQMTFGNITAYIVPIILLSLFVLLVKPLIIMAIMALFGYPKRVNFFTGFTLAQISEFSLVLIALGIKNNQLSQDVLSLITAVGLITIAGSSYFIHYSSALYTSFNNRLNLFERKRLRYFDLDKKKKYDILLFGYNRIGFDLVESFKKLKKKFFIVDYNPEIVNKLTKQRVPCLYGDADDNELLDELNLGTFKMIVSTVPDFETNILLIEKIRVLNKKSIVMVVSHDIQEAKELYVQGATYVIMSHFLGGSYTSLLISKYGFHLNKFLKEKKKHMARLVQREQMGHAHPKIDKNV